MGRKKRKIADDGTATGVPGGGGPGTETLAPPSLPPPPPPPSSTVPAATKATMIEGADQNDKQGTKTASSGYAMTTHSAEIVDEDLYVSDGSEDDDEDEVVEMVLAGSRMGVMRRGIHHPMLMQPNRQSTQSRQDQKAGCDGPLDAEAETKKAS